MHRSHVRRLLARLGRKAGPERRVHARAFRHAAASELALAGLPPPAIAVVLAAGRLLFGVLAVVAQFEADLIAERTRDGLAAARRRGRYPGRPRLLDRRARNRAARLRRAGKTLREIAAILGCSKSTVARVLSSS